MEFATGLFMGIIVGGLLGAWNAVRAFKKALEKADKL